MEAYLFLSGEHPELPYAEAVAVFEAEHLRARWTRPHPRLALVTTDAPREGFEAAVRRLAFTHDAGFVLGQAPYEEAAVRALAWDALPTGATVAARAQRLAEGTPWHSARAEAIVGAASRHPVHLQSPVAVLRAFLCQERIVLGWRWVDRDPAELDARHVRRRPFFSPVSLEPKWARALVNLARVRTGDLVVDPFCGTGGILLEAAAMGMRVAGSDLDPAMVEGTRRNLAHFGYEAEALVVCDASELPQALRGAGAGPAQAVVTDLPYGRSASTGREERLGLYRRAARTWPSLLQPGGHLVVGVPDEAGAEAAAGTLAPAAAYAVRAHRSLTRRFVICRRRAID